MRRALLRSLAFLAATGPAAGVAAASAAGAPNPVQPPRATLENPVCMRAVNPLDRAIGVTSVMRPVTGTQKMEIRFVLMRRSTPGSPPTAVHGGDLGRWLLPKPVTLGQRSSDVWKLKKLVVNLAAPSAYRFRVTFQWLGASGAQIQRTTLLSGVCNQPR